MPVYNADRYLARAVDSILGQSFPDFELICVDDGSTDRSSAILDRFARQDGRLKVVRRGNTGIVGALNDGLATAAGRFIARMDADDISLPDRLRLQVAHLEAHPLSVIVGSAARAIDSDDDPIADMAAPETHEQIETQLLAGNSLALVHPSVCIRTDALRRIGGYRPSTSEDLDMFLRICEVGRAANLSDVLLLYRQHLQSLTTLVKFEERLQNRETVLREAYARRGLDASGLVVTAGYRPSSPFEYHVRMAQRARGGGYRRTAVKHAFRALCRQPWSLSVWQMAARSVASYIRHRRSHDTR